MNTDFKSKFNWAEIAIEDFFNWFLPISKICDEKFNKPTIKISYSEKMTHKDTIHLDINFFRDQMKFLQKILL